MRPSPRNERSSWLDRLLRDPDGSLDKLLRGVAHLPGLQRASPVEAALALTDCLDDEAQEWLLLDSAVLKWLKIRRQSADAFLDRPGGIEQFIRETGEAFRMVWRLKLPNSSAWVLNNMFDILRWAESFTVDAKFDLANSVLAAAAHLQEDAKFRFLWFHVCDDAATERLRHRLDIALLGLVRLPDPTGGPSHNVTTGLARWASRLPTDERYKGAVVREWRALKATFPRQPSFWRSRWQAILDDAHYNHHPFLQWLQDAEPALHNKVPSSRREPLVPNNIKRINEEFSRQVRRDGLTQANWLPVKQLLEQLEIYADRTGYAYYFVTSCTYVGSAILPYAPAEALSLARRALVWAPNDAYSWSMRARALERLGRPELAQAVLWEGMRRAPSSPALAHQLALLLSGQGNIADLEAEALLKKANLIDPGNGQSQVDLARILWVTGRPGAAIALLRGYVAKHDDSVALYTLGSLFLAEGQPENALKVLDVYGKRFGSHPNTELLARLIGMGPLGATEVRRHLLSERRPHDASFARVPWDTELADRILTRESTDAPALLRIAAVAEADLIFALGTARHEAQQRVDAALRDDDSDVYAHLVKALADDDFRQSMEGRAGRFAGCLPLQLALTGPHAPTQRWEDLRDRFPDDRPLISLARLARGIAEDCDYQALERWIAEVRRWDDPWGGFLRDQVEAHMGNGTPSVPLNLLEHDALAQAVNVGWNASPQAA